MVEIRSITVFLLYQKPIPDKHDAHVGITGICSKVYGRMLVQITLISEII